MATREVVLSPARCEAIGSSTMNETLSFAVWPLCSVARRAQMFTWWARLGVGVSAHFTQRLMVADTVEQGCLRSRLRQNMNSCNYLCTTLTNLGVNCLWRSTPASSFSARSAQLRRDSPYPPALHRYKYIPPKRLPATSDGCDMLRGGSARHHLCWKGLALPLQRANPPAVKTENSATNFIHHTTTASHRLHV